MFLKKGREGMGAEGAPATSGTSSRPSCRTAERMSRSASSLPYNNESANLVSRFESRGGIERHTADVIMHVAEQPPPTAGGTYADWRNNQAKHCYPLSGHPLALTRLTVQEMKL